jgi:hypothetical protein
MISIILSVVIFLIGTLSVVSSYGIQSSLSASYYRLPLNRQWLFTLWCIGYAVPFMYVDNSIFIKLAAIFIMVVGSAAAFRGDELIEKVHMASAALAVIAAHVAMIFEFNNWIISSISLALSAYFYFFKNNTNGVWWAEVVTYISIIIVLFINAFT